jgi:hypothetical protein
MTAALFLLIIIAAALFWAAGAYLFPFRHCRKCGGTGRKIRKLNRSHYALCPRCAGTGRVQRRGARLVHRAALTARTQISRQRADRRARKAAERAAAPAPPRTGPRRRY